MRAVVRSGHGPEPSLGGIEQDLADLQHRLGELPDHRAARPMLALAAALDLDDDQVDFLWTAVALAANPLVRRHAAALDELAVEGLTTSLYCRIAELSPDRSRRIGLAFVSGHPAVHHGLVHMARSARIPTAWPVAAAPELICHLAGEPLLDPRFAELLRPSSAFLDTAQERAVARIAEALASDAPVAIVIEGAEGSGRRTAVTLASDRPALAVDLRQHPAEALADVLLGLRRECLIRGALPVIAGIEPRDRARALAQFVDDAREPVVLIASRPGLELGLRLPAARLSWPVPDGPTRARVWAALAGEVGAHPTLASRFAVGAGTIQRAVERGRILARGRAADAAVTADDLIAGVRATIAERLGGLAARVDVRRTWDDLVLAEEPMAQVRALVSLVRHSSFVHEQWGYRSRRPGSPGLAALFSGPAGTGKTLVAGLLAEELDRDLYRIDLREVLSTWTGDTDHQLARVFAAAHAAHAVLLLDEADALFGQRSSDVRAAGILLDRLDASGGLVILTSTLDVPIDRALERRLAAHVVFAHPEEKERALLWRGQLSAGTAPLAPDIDVDELARTFPKMTGARIQNAVLTAAFLTAAELRGAITHDTVMHAARGEYLAMGQAPATAPAPRQRKR